MIYTYYPYWCYGVDMDSGHGHKNIGEYIQCRYGGLKGYPGAKVERVHIEFDGYVQLKPNSARMWVVPDGMTEPVNVPKQFATPADPKNWPPQVGDIWEADGDEWATISYSKSEPLMCNVDDSEKLNLGLYQFKDLNPILVRRRNVPMA